MNMNQKIMTSKRQPSWVKDKEALQKHIEPPAEFVGERGVAGVIDGLLPNGEPYGWYKRRGTKDTKFKGRKV
jgi:hypothetical protein